MKQELDQLYHDIAQLKERAQKLGALAKQDVDARVPKDEERSRRELMVAKSVAHRLERADQFLVRVLAELEIGCRDAARDVVQEMKDAGFRV